MHASITRLVKAYSLLAALTFNLATPRKFGRPFGHHWGRLHAPAKPEALRKCTKWSMPNASPPSDLKAAATPAVPQICPKEKWSALFCFIRPGRQAINSLMATVVGRSCLVQKLASRCNPFGFCVTGCQAQSLGCQSSLHGLASMQCDPSALSRIGHPRTLVLSLNYFFQSCLRP